MSNKPTKKQKAILVPPELAARLRKEVGDYPLTYNAHNDTLLDDYELAETVNTLLKLLREVVRAGEEI